MISPISPFILPGLVGSFLLIISLYLFRKGTLRGRELVIAILTSFLLILSFPIYHIIILVKEAFGITYSFVAIFFFAILFLVVLNFYLLIRLNRLNDQIIELWQELSLFNIELMEDK